MLVNGMVLTLEPVCLSFPLLSLGFLNCGLQTLHSSDVLSGLSATSDTTLARFLSAKDS